MPRFRSLPAVLHVAIGTIVVAIVLRTWVVMGLAAPVTVTGSSMAPTLLDQHLQVDCPGCEATLRFGLSYAAHTDEISCPQCQSHVLSLAGKKIIGSDHLWIDRTSLLRSPPRRGEVFVLRNPDDASQLSVKRVLGLPGETIEIRQGDVYVDHRPLELPLALQRELRVLVHKETQDSSRWHPDPNSRWQRNQDAWHLDPGISTPLQWLRYVHPQEEPLTDDLPYNVGLSRRLNPVADVMLQANVALLGNGHLLLQFYDGQRYRLLTISRVGDELSVGAGHSTGPKTAIPKGLQQRLMGEGAQLEISCFNQQLLLAIDSRVLWTSAWERHEEPCGGSRPLSIGSLGVGVRLGQLRLYRDLYYTPQALGLPQVPGSQAVRLPPEHYFLLGDNSPVSIDSRRWGGVSGRLFVGRVVGNR